MCIKFVYDGHRVKVKVAGAKKARNSLLPQCKTLMGSKTGSVEDGAIACSMGFSAMMMMMMSYAWNKIKYM